MLDPSYAPSTPTRAAALRDAGGFLPLDAYGVLGDGRTVALSGADGSIDWWCVPNIDSPPVCDRLLDAPEGGRWVIQPAAPFTVERRYRDGSNVLETDFTTGAGRARLTESLNSGTAGRLPWTELARRVEGLEGEVAFHVEFSFSRRVDEANSFFSTAGGRQVFHLGTVLGLVLLSEGVDVERWDDQGINASFTVAAGERRTVAVLAGDDEPLMAPRVEVVDGRIDVSDGEWRQWSDRLFVPDEYRGVVTRSALALKLLLFTPTGAIAAAATSSLPERIGGGKNWDYRYAWVRDAGYTIRALLLMGAHQEAKLAFTWLLDRLAGDATPHVAYTLEGDPMPPQYEVDVPGWRDTRPVLRGNDATLQRQHGVFGDTMETAAAFLREGMLDASSAATLSRLADRCADVWRRPDSGIWELHEQRHYTMSKISAWEALARAVELADAGHLPTTCRDRWARERDRIEAWVNANCWSEAKQAYTFYAGSDEIDASLALAVPFRFDGQDRLRSTLDAIDRELGAGPFHYRYTGMDREEGCFLACSFWMVEARAMLGEVDRAKADFVRLTQVLDRGVGVLPEMIDPETGEFLGNLPQGLTHLALVHAAAALVGTP